MLPSVLRSWRVPTLQVPIKAFKDGLQLVTKDNVLTHIQRYLTNDLQAVANTSSQAVSVRPTSDLNLKLPEYLYFWESLKKCFGFGSKKGGKGKSKSGKKKQTCKSKGKCSKKKDTCLKKKESNVCAKPADKAKPDCKPKDDKKSVKSDPCKKDPPKKKEEKKSEPCKKEVKKADPCKKKDDKKKEEPCKKKEEKKSDPCKKKEDKKDDPCKKKEDPCKKKEDASQKKADPCKKKEDPCKKKEEPSKKKEDPCKKKEDPCKKKEDPCKKKEDPSKKREDPCKKKEDPCKKKEDPCKKKEDPCKKKEDPCKKKEDPCKKKEDPCKKDDPCKKKEDPCKKKEDPCQKKEDPCKKKEEPSKKEDLCKKEDPCKKKEDPCKKKDDPCKKKEDPCKKKDPCGDNFISNESLSMDPILFFSMSHPASKKEGEMRGACKDPCAPGACDVLPGQDEPCGSSVSWKVKVNPCRQRSSSSKTKCSKPTACIVDSKKKEDEKMEKDSNDCGLVAHPCGKKVCPNRCEIKKNTKFSSVEESFDVGKLNLMNADQTVDIPSLAVNFASQRGTTGQKSPSPNKPGIPAPAPGSVAQKVTGIIGKIKGFWNGPVDSQKPTEKQQPRITNVPINTPGRSPGRYPTRQQCEGLETKYNGDSSLLNEGSEQPALPANSGFVFAAGPPQDDFEKCEDRIPPCPVEIDTMPCPKKGEDCEKTTDEIWSDIDESYGYEKFPFKQEHTRGQPLEVVSLQPDDPYSNHRL